MSDKEFQEIKRMLEQNPEIAVKIDAERAPKVFDKSNGGADAFITREKSDCHEQKEPKAKPKKPRKSVTALHIIPTPSQSGSETDLLWGYPAGDVGNGQRFRAMHRDNVLCDDRRAKNPVWFEWDGTRWKEASEAIIRELAHQVGVEYVKQAAEWRSGNADPEVAKAEEEAVRKRAALL